MANKKLIDRQWGLSALAVIKPANVGAALGFDVVVPPGALVTAIRVQTVTAFNGTTPTATVGDGTTTFANAVDLTSTGAETVANVPKYYPNGGTISVNAANAGGSTTAGLALVAVDYIVVDRGNEIVN